MKYLKKYNKTFENLRDVHSLCHEYEIENYTINSDGSIDVDGSVFLYKIRLTKLPLQFRNVSGDFTCSNNNLKSLEGCPKTVGGAFSCSYNKLTTLEGSPDSVGGYFVCSDNKLTSLEGCPKVVGGNFYCQYNKLTSLEGAPKSVGGNFNCQSNKLTSFEGFETRIGDFFYCDNNPIYEIWNLFEDTTKIELFNYYDIIQDGVVIMDRLNDFLIEIGKDPVEKVMGYKCI